MDSAVASLVLLPEEILHFLFSFFPVTAEVRSTLGLVCKAFRKCALPEELDLEGYKEGKVKVFSLVSFC